MDRREFLKYSAGMVGAAALSPQMVFADEKKEKGPNSPTLVVVYLRGGADPLNAIIPHGDPTYYDIRPTIAIPPRDEGNVKGVLKIHDYFGLHPSMAPLLPIFNAGMLAPIVNVGSPHDTRSHFDAQDFMERAAPGIKTVTEGWLNRYLEMTKGGKDNDLRALSFQTLLPRSLRGQFPVLAVPEGESAMIMDEFEKLYTCEDKKPAEPAKPGAKAPIRLPQLNQPKRITSVEAHNTIVQAGANEIRRIRELKEIVSREGRGENYPHSRFGRQMGDIAQVIKADRGLEVVAIDYEGWDHHIYEGGSEGAYGKMIGDVSATLRAFHDDLGPQRMKKTLVLTMSEFGRTAKENGSNGSDHGHGGFMLAMGGMIKRKDLYGIWTGLEPGNLYEKRDMPVTTDFRLIFSEALEALFGFDPYKHQFFPAYRPATRPLGFLNRVV